MNSTKQSNSLSYFLNECTKRKLPTTGIILNKGLDQSTSTTAVVTYDEELSRNMESIAPKYVYDNKTISPVQLIRLRNIKENEKISDINDSLYGIFNKATTVTQLNFLNDSIKTPIALVSGTNTQDTARILSNIINYSNITSEERFHLSFISDNSTTEISISGDSKNDLDSTTQLLEIMLNTTVKQSIDKKIRESNNEPTM